MKNLDEIWKGLFWGIGFAIPAILVYTGYGNYAQAGLELTYQKNMRVLYEEQIMEEYGFLQAEVIGFRKTDGGIVVASKTNKLSGIIGSRYKMKFSMMSSDAFSGNCYQDLDVEITDKDFSFYQTTCNGLYSDSNNITDIAVSVIRR
jgi:hypothetical protein